MRTHAYSRIICADIANSVGCEVVLSSSKLSLWLVLDFLFTQTVINVLSTASWRGVWNIIDIVFSGEGGVFQDVAYTDSAVTCSAGILLNILIYLTSNNIQKQLEKRSKPVFLILSRVFTAIYFIIYMLLWRSFWNLQYLLFPSELSKLIAFLVSTVLLCLVGCFNSNIGVPCSIELDTIPDYCVIATFLSHVDKLDKSLLVWSVWTVADVLCTSIIEILVIVCWFGTYEYIVSTLPVQPAVSQLAECLVPLALGTVTGAGAVVAQLVLVVWVEGRQSSQVRRRVVHFLLACLGLLSTIFHWYGMWTLLDYYIIPQHPVYSNLATTVCGILGLALLGASRSLHGGVARDGQPGEGYPLQPYYFIAAVGSWGSFLS